MQSPRNLSDIDRFTIEGVIDGQPVSGTWSHGVVVGDPALLYNVRQVVLRGEMGEQSLVTASLSHSHGAAVALARAMDQVLAFELFR